MPVTRGGAQSTPASLSSNSDVSETDVSQQYSVNIDSLIAPLSGSLSTLDDNAVVHGREAKVLRDATSAAISQLSAIDWNPPQWLRHWERMVLYLACDRSLGLRMMGSNFLSGFDAWRTCYE
ncbi:hypothetical protein Q1695_006009 [Nippostrongylus brasiliensis]|nr:hypothetical protein Q1695_006009 [Nippostrongylus brasiliensis]